MNCVVLIASIADGEVVIVQLAHAIKVAMLATMGISVILVVM